jgi:hypothetical protein
MTLRHISPRSSDWMDAMDEGGRGWEKLAPEERAKLRVEAQSFGAAWEQVGQDPVSQEKEEEEDDDEDDYGWETVSASR